MRELAVIWVVDRLVCAKLLKSGGAQWFLLHSIGNMFVVLGSLADFYFTFKNPFKVLSLQYCKTLPSYACNDWPTCIIIALHPTIAWDSS